MEKVANPRSTPLSAGTTGLIQKIMRVEDKILTPLVCQEEPETPEEPETEAPEEGEEKEEEEGEEEW